MCVDDVAGNICRPWVEATQVRVEHTEVGAPGTGAAQRFPSPHCVFAVYRRTSSPSSPTTPSPSLAVCDPIIFVMCDVVGNMASTGTLCGDDVVSTGTRREDDMWWPPQRELTRVCMSIWVQFGSLRVHNSSNDRHCVSAGLGLWACSCWSPGPPPRYGLPDIARHVI